jgi:hypothetical protein
MGIKGVDVLTGAENTLEEHHVVMAYQSGDHQNVGLYLIGPETRENASEKAQNEFRQDNEIEERVVVISNFLYSGGSMRALQVYEHLSKKIEEKKKEADEGV